MRQVSKRYGSDSNSTFGVRDFTLTIDRGDFLALCGPSGSGKTTVLNLLGALDKPSSGTIFLEGKRLDILAASELAQIRLNRLGFIFQSYNLIPVMDSA